MNNEQVLLAKYPKGMPQDDTFKYENIDIVDPNCLLYTSDAADDTINV